MEAELMRVLQLAKCTVLTLAAVAVAGGCGSESAPTVPFNPAGATADVEAVNSTFASPTVTNFASLSVLFDAALGGAPLVSGSTAALDIRGGTPKAVQAALARSAERIARIVPRPATGGFSASTATIPSEFLGKTFIYSGGSYVVSAQTGAPANGVRFLLYTVDPATSLPEVPLVQAGRVDLVDMSAGSTSAARVIVVSGSTTYLDYRVSATSTATSGRVTVLGLITDGNTEATFNLRSVLTLDAGLTLSYSLDVPERDLSIDLALSASGTMPESSTIGMTLDMRGQNGWVRFTGQISASGGTFDVAINGTPFATVTSTTGAEPVITGSDGQPLAQEEIDALQQVLEFSGGSFAAFDELIAPVGVFLGGA
jgi:hypothetical protein